MLILSNQVAASGANFFAGRGINDTLLCPLSMCSLYHLMELIHHTLVNLIDQARYYICSGWRLPLQKKYVIATIAKILANLTYSWLHKDNPVEIQITAQYPIF
jgi:hypothetical protein